MAKNYRNDEKKEYDGKTEEYITVAKNVKKALGDTRNDRSVEKIKDQKASGVLYYKFTKYIKPSLEIMLNNFIEVLEDPDLDREPNYRRLLAYETNFPDVFNVYGYELSSMMCLDKTLSQKGNRAFFDFPLFFQEACRTYGIYRYSTMNIEDVEEIVAEVVDMRYQKSSYPRKDRPNVIEDEKLLYMHNKETNSNRLAKIALDSSYKVLAAPYKPGKVENVIDNYGAGYGFSLLSHEPYGEMLVAVKASKEDGFFRLSKQEYTVMRNSEDSKCSRYFIHSYIFDEKGNVLSSLVLRYDKENELLVDTKDESNVYNIEELVKIKDGGTVVNYACTPVKVKINNQKNPMKYLFTMN